VKEWRATVDFYIRAETEEETFAVMENILTHAEAQPKVKLAVYGTGGFEEDVDDPQCVCGVYRSEHALCGCGEWQRS
jgi:hypothetical protein